MPPVQFAALGAAAGFYVLFSSHAVVSIIGFIAIIIFFFIIKYFTPLKTDKRFLYMFTVSSISFAAGLVIGICAGFAGKNNVNFGMPEKNVTGIEGVLLEDPRVIKGGNALVSLSLRRSASFGGLRVSSHGEVFVFFPQESADKLKQFGRGAVVYAEGSLRSSSLGWSFSADSLHVVKRAPAIEEFRTSVRANLVNRFGKEKWSALASALLLGVRDNLDIEFVSVYRSAGLSYILALSGMHLAIITALISFILKKPLGLKGCAIAGAFIIIVYCLLVGPMPSLNRSALMYILGVLAILGALPKKAMSILSLSFLIQIIITPSAGNTLSFILSYLALAGILIIGKAFSSLFAGKIPDSILQPLSLSIGAFLATAGVCSYFFGTIAPVGILSGLIIVPLTTIFMIGSIIYLVLDFISLSFLLNFPLSFLYRAMELTASVSGKAPGIFANYVLVLALSSVLMLAIIVTEKRRREDMLKLKPFLW